MKSQTDWKPDKWQIALGDWLATQAFTKPGRILDDIHFNQLLGKWINARDGVEMATFCCDALRQALAAVRMQHNLRDVRTAVVALPLDLSNRIRLWKPHYWRRAGMGQEPPSLILIKDERFNTHFDEEYYRKVDVPIAFGEEVLAVYKSYRALSGPSSVDVGNTIFLIGNLSTDLHN